jgi:ABC-2 type transport system ATP-binding protein
MLIVQNLTKNFHTTKAVDGVSFTINKGEIFSLIGPNSSGKSTIVKSIAGLLQPTYGSITIDNHNIVTSPEQAKAVIGYIPDEPSIWSYMTGEEFLYFTQALFRRSKEKTMTSPLSMIPAFGLEGLEKNYFEEYSRGNKQKFSILAALSHSPKLLLVDEPIVGLDPTSAEIAKKLFIDYARHGGSVLLVTHTLSVAEEISDRIGFLKNGKLISVGTLDELRSQASLPHDATLSQIYAHLTA